MDKLLEKIYQEMLDTVEAERFGFSLGVSTATEDALFAQLIDMVGQVKAGIMWEELYKKAKAEDAANWAEACK